MTDTTPNLALPEIAAAQAQKHVTHNEALRVLDAIVHLAVLDRDPVSPPDTPAEGQRWLVGTPASGGWAGHENDIAAWQDGGWQFYPPHVGWLAYVMDEEALVAWSGSAWAPALDLLGGATELQNMALLGIGTAADSTNPLSAKLNNALWAARTEAEGGDGDLRYKLSKESEGKTLSLLFQDNFSGRAEIGLAGDDDFHVKVSDDGTTWRDAIAIDKSTGQVSFPQGGASSDLELTVAGLSLGLAGALNAAQFLGASGNRVADSFDALTYVDVVGATHLDSSVAGVLKPTMVMGTSLIPAMTSATTSGVTITASQIYGTGYEGWRVGDGNLLNTGANTSWDTNTGALPATLTVDFGSGQTAAQYQMYPPTSAGSYAPKTWTLDGSADNASWTTLDTRTNFTGWGAADGAHPSSFTIASPGSYRYYRLRVTAVGSGTEVILPELKLCAPGVADNMTVTSTRLSATNAPNSVKLVVRIKSVEAVDLNTDYVVEFSRNNGMDWTQVNLVEQFSQELARIVESDPVDLSSQVSGMTPKWRLRTFNNKMIETLGIYVYWF